MTQERRILAIDYGEKRIGLAITDPMCIFATGMPTLHADGDVVKKIQAIVHDKHVIEIVIGLPKRLDGRDTHATELVRAFVEKLKRVVDIPIVCWDERFTSLLAEQTIRELGVGKKKRSEKAKVDELAAVHLLQHYLSSRVIERDQ